MKKRNLTLAALAVAAAALTGCSGSRTTHAASVEKPSAKRSSGVALACQGRVEGRTETVEVGAAADGIIQTVHVTEGDTVRKGDKLAEISCPDIKASLSEALAQVDSANQVRARLLRGSRDEERRMAAEKTKAARSVLQRANLNLERVKGLFTRAVVSKAMLDDAQRDHDVAEAALEEATRNEQLVNSPPLPEDVAKANADVAAAENRVFVIQEKIAKYTVTAPSNGTILRVLLHPGEAFSTMAPKPLFTMADTSVRRVRAEVDERDVMKVRVGQKVLVSADGHEDQKFPGKVQEIASAMGRKRIVSGDPAEKTDHDVLESMVLLGGTAKTLPIGMRVVVQFLD
jgi:multidrug resistance efflux pump